MNMMLQYLDGAIIAGLIAVAFVLYHALRRDRRKPPEAAGGWPLIGHLPILGASGQPHVTLGDLADKYGPIFCIRIGIRKAVVVSSWEVAKECFTTHDVIVSSRPRFTAAKILGYDYANFSFSPYGSFWREMRKIAASELLSTRRFEIFGHIRDAEVHSSLKEVYKLWANKRDDSGTVPMEMKRWFGDTNLNVILRMITGKRCSGEDVDEEEVRRWRDVFREFFRLTGLVVLGDALPFLGWLDFGGYVKEMKKTAKEMDKIMCQWLEENRQKRASGVLKTEQDFIDVMLSVVHCADLGGYDADTVIKATCSVIMAGATDTTAVTMTWGLSLLLNHRDVLKKVQDELDAKVGKDRLVSETDINKLEYLQAVVKETLRLYPAGPLSGPREFTEDCTLGGYHIEAGTRLILNLWKLQRDQRVWSEASEFRPERFMGTHKEVDVKGQHFELIPFGAGRRACPGIAFGLQMTHLALAGLLQAFDVTTPSDAAVDMSATFGLTHIKTDPLQVLFSPRLSPSLFR
ncbi:cytochrome P450 CYP82D47-like [Neltuma alba]|uniref:cytochrome P450 CYP82D47-like n=1 Tax=Neltuma alba TaxID=207710 RepID=UPI0010A59C4F|nr:cytochrome P450 CYP82D47-like [Prosopis alba]XP_028757662.1 cytochrome P450 CYP82D47-like [Prosopis alba]